MMNLETDDKYYEHFKTLNELNPKLYKNIKEYLDRVSYFLKEIKSDLSRINLPSEQEQIEQDKILSLDKSGNPKDIEERNKYIKNIEIERDGGKYANRISYLPLTFYEVCLREEYQPIIKDDVEFQKDCAYLLYAKKALENASTDLNDAEMNIKMIRGQPVIHKGKEISPITLLKLDDENYPYVSTLFDTYGYTKLKELLKK
ncbi:MAG: hypothetical protein QW525_01610 [Thermoplasmatales archaeon]